MDNLGVHHGKPVKAWLLENSTKMEVFYLSSWSPELNPQERLNADLKPVIRGRVAAVEHMTALQSKAQRVKSFFQDPLVKYAA